MTDYSWTPLRKTISGTPTRTSHKISSARATSLVMGNVAQKYVFSCVRLCNKADKIIITNGWHTGNFIGSFIDNFIGSFLNQSDRQRSMIELTGDVLDPYRTFAAIGVRYTKKYLEDGARTSHKNIFNTSYQLGDGKRCAKFCLLVRKHMQKMMNSYLVVINDLPAVASSLALSIVSSVVSTGSFNR